MLPEKHKPTVMQMMLEKASKADLIRQFNTINLPAILEGNYPLIAGLKRQHGLAKVEKIVKIMVLDLSTAFGEELNTVADELAVEIASLHYNLTLEDIFLVFKQLKTTPIYGKINQNKVLTALNDYWEERMEKVEKINLNKHLQNKQPFGERNNKATEIARHREVIKQYLKGK